MAEELDIEKEKNKVGVDIDGEILVKKSDVDNLNEKVGNLTDDNTSLKNRKMSKKLSPKRAKILTSIFGGVALVSVVAGATALVLGLTKQQAQPTNVCILTFDSTNKGKFDEGTPNKIEIAKGSKWKDISKPIPVGNKDEEKGLQYTFIKWIKNNGEEINNDDEINNNLNLVGIYEENALTKIREHKINFNAGEGGKIDSKDYDYLSIYYISNQTQKITFGDFKELYVIPHIIPNDNYKFIGWEDKDKGLVEDGTVVLEGDNNYIAKYEYIEPTEKQCTVTYDVTDSTSHKGKTEVKINQGLLFSDIYKPEVFKTGYSFQYWADQDNKEFKGSEIIQTEELKLHPVWKEDTTLLKITFDKGEDYEIVGADTTYFKAGMSWGQINKPNIKLLEEEKKEQSGWYYIREDGSEFELDDSMTIKTGLRVKPRIKDKAVKCNVKFTLSDENAGSLSGQLSMIVDEGTLCKNINFPRVTENEGWNFLGWYKDGENPIDITSKIDKNCKMIAMFNYTPIIKEKMTNILATEDSSLEYKNYNANINYSFDGKNWSRLPNTGNGKLSIPKNSILYLKGNNPNGLNPKKGTVSTTFKITGEVLLDGSIMGLLDNGEGNINYIPTRNCFNHLFNSSSGIISVSENFLPVKDLSVKGELDGYDGCYAYLFSNCTNLKNIPLLPATKLSPYCYNRIFYQCKSINTIPNNFALEADIVSRGAYNGMFCGCEKIEELPIKTLKSVEVEEDGYNEMFCGTGIKEIPNQFLNFIEAKKNICYGMFWNTKIQTVPEDLFNKINKISGDTCFAYMFQDCKKLENIPENLLPFEELTDTCYMNMFKDCSNLKNIAWLPAKKLARGCYAGMYAGCTSLSEKINKDVFVDYIFDYVEEFAINWCDGMFGNGTYTGDEPFTLPKWDKLKPYCFSGLNGGCKNIKTIPEDYLQWKELEEGCYCGMFRECNNLEEIPEKLLPSTTLAESCYKQMFGRCSGLKSIPKNLLIGEILKRNCYEGMFSGCNNLISIPEGFLNNGKNLAEKCFTYMFQDCKKLESVPENLLPVTTLCERCYAYMFDGCVKLKNTPNLPALVVARKCYMNMFNNCYELNKCMRELPATKLAKECYDAMFRECKSLSVAPIIKGLNAEKSTFYYMFSGCSKLKINNTGSSGTLFFTAPESFADYSCKDMFEGTGGSYTDDPIPNGKYYYE